MIQLSSVNAILVLLDSKVGSLAHLFIVELVADHFILLYCVTVVLELTLLLARRPESSLNHLVPHFIGNC